MAASNVITNHKYCRHGHTAGNTDSGGRKYSNAYKTWKSMIWRCQAKSGLSFRIYVQRGITVCDRWKVFANFLEDMGNPADGLFIDRIDNFGGYSKENCRWVTYTQNNRNRIRTIKIEFRGETRPMAEWAEIFGLDYETLRTRLKRGWPVETAFTHPLVAVTESRKIGRTK